MPEYYHQMAGMGRAIFLFYFYNFKKNPFLFFPSGLIYMDWKLVEVEHFCSEHACMWVFRKQHFSC